MSTSKISIDDWRRDEHQADSPQHALFNCNPMSEAGKLEGNSPFCISINDTHYMSYKRHASAVVGGMSLGDMSTLLNNIPQVRGELAARGIRSLSLSSWNAENDLEALYELLQLQCQIRFEFMLDTEQYVPSKISSNHKRNIKKSEKSGAQVSLPVGIESMRSHIELVNRNLSAKGVGGITNCPEYFQFLIDSKAGLLMQVKEGGKLLASTFFYINQDYSYYHSSGTDEAGKRVGAAHFLVDRMISEMRKREIRYLNLGGCTSEQTGLYRFKLGFRPETRILISAKRLVVSTIKGKLRSILSVRPNSLLSTAHQQVFIKNLVETASVAESDHLFRKLSFRQICEAVGANPELCESLSVYSRPGRSCYGLFGKKEQLIAIGFTQGSEGDKSIAPARESPGSKSAEIADIYVLRAMRKEGIGTALLENLEQEMGKLGYSRVYTRIDTDNAAATKLFLARGFSNEGKELSLSTALIKGKKRVIGKVEI